MFTSVCYPAPNRITQIQRANNPFDPMPMSLNQGAGPVSTYAALMLRVGTAQHRGIKTTARTA